MVNEIPKIHITDAIPMKDLCYNSISLTDMSDEMETCV